MKTPKKGDKLYIPTQLYISRGSDDIAGGIATINRIDLNPNLPDDHVNKIMVGFEGFPSGRSWNYRSLMEKQKELEKEYEGKVAKPDPDIDTPFIEDGDYVNGEIYRGKPIW